MTNYIIIVLLFIIHSCRLNCQDCGPISTGSYNLKNEGPSILTLIFYGNKDIGFKQEKILLTPNVLQPFLYYRTGVPPSTILSSELYAYDSVGIYNSNNQLIRILKKGICQNNNILCTSDYKQISEEKSKKGGKNTKYEMIVK